MWNLDNVSFIKFSGRLSFNIILKLEKSGWSYSYEAEPISKFVLLYNHLFGIQTYLCLINLIENPH